MRRLLLAVVFSVAGFFVTTTLVITSWVASVKEVAAGEVMTLPRSAVIATHSVGSGFNADGTGIAKLVSENSPMTMIVRPHPGPPAWLPAMNKGEIEFGILISSDAAAARKGVAIYKAAFPNVRLVLVGAPLFSGFWAPAGSPMRTVADLRGKRVPSGWSGLPILHFTATACLATAGLTWDDVIKTPVTELDENMRAFMEGRTDVFHQSIGAPGVEEANARTRGGIRLLAIGTEPEGLKRMAEINPGAYMLRLKKGQTTGILEDTPVNANDMYVVAPAQLSDDVIYSTVKVLWDHNDQMRKISPRLRPWARERMVSKAAAIPYHPGSIRFFREKAAWSGEMEALQKKLLAP
ncbi:MAG: TAXI family TRAP transporter solute-binding subunit [Deltaproteobacteria bacterium]|nr:TAXI family TRAP transporter solute-binding subunit [Deltaproteobacteria bacterium]